MPGRQQIPSLQLASGTTDERDLSYNLTTIGSVFYNTDTNNVEVRHVDPSNNVGWRDLVVNNKEQIDISGNVDISGKLVVDGGVSFNADLSVVGNLYVDGNLGIGKTIPLVPLHVYSSDSFQGTDSSINLLPQMNSISYLSEAATASETEVRHYDFASNTSYNISIYAEGAVFSGTYIGASDKRIKKNITEIDDERSLVQLRTLPCVDYDYIDNFKNGEYKTVGFIAQDVKEIMPNCVQTVSDIIPNEMRLLENLEWEPVVKDISSNEPGYKLINQELEEASYKFFVRDFSSNEKSLEVSYPFIFDKKWDEVFCYGKRVDDFLAIDKNKIFALGFSATQQIDRIQQKHIIDISNMKTENTELKRQIIQLTTDISFMKTENTEQKGQIIQLTTDISMIRNQIGI